MTYIGLKLFEYVNEGPDASPIPVGASGPDNKGGVEP